MPVERLDALLDSVWSYRLGLVVAPAGAGKTTLLARFAARAPGPVGWYRAEPWDRDEPALLRHLEAALAPQMAGLETGWQRVADAANALDAWRDGPVLLVIDDLHTLEGTPAEAALEQLVDYAPSSLTILAASRLPPSFNLPRLRVSGALVEVCGDDLRFRSWEVERLFRDYYREPLPPEELARLARRTEGWAAGLQLFHLATSGKRPDERKRVLAALGPSSRLMRDYLTRNVVEQLSVELREFLVETSVLGRLNAALCDQLLERTGSGDTLAELERRNLFTQALPEEGAYRYHEVLRSYLQGALLQDLGEGRLRDRFRRAGQLLAAAEALPEALEAYCRAEDWQSAQALLGRDGAQAAGSSSAWLDALPASVLLHDPWLLLASARRLRAEGRLADAVERYQRAEAAFAGTDPAELCRAERRAITNWLDDPSGPPRRDWSGLLRQAVTREPASTAREAGGTGTPAGQLVCGLSMLLAGDVASAEHRLLALAEADEPDALVGMSAAIGAGIAQLIGGKARGAIEIDGAVEASERFGFDWLARLGRSSRAIGGGADARREALTVAVACAAADDRWGAALAKLFAAWGAVNAGEQPDDIDSLLAELRALRASVLEAWAYGLRAVAIARAGEPDARGAALQSEAIARSAGVPAARLFSYLALGAASTVDAPEYLEQAMAIGAETGIALPTVGRPGLEAPRASTGVGNGHASAPPVRIRLLGGYRLEVDGAQIELGGVRPRVRSLLRLLSLHAGAPVHHEQIEAALWPDADSMSASRNLHVAVAALRRALEPSAGRGGFQLVRRIGDAYVLSLPVGAEVDLLRLEVELDVGRAARSRGEIESARRSFRAVLDEYRGELLPEEGPAEWVTDRRESARLAVVEAAQALAELLLADGDAEAAASVCAAGLRVERYHDPLWRLLIRARDQAGDQGAATRARHGYGRMLAELGVEASPAPFSGAP